MRVRILREDRRAKLDGEVHPTLEVVIDETPSHLRRRHDPATGLPLIDLKASE